MAELLMEVKKAGKYSARIITREPMTIRQTFLHPQWDFEKLTVVLIKRKKTIRVPRQCVLTLKDREIQLSGGDKIVVFPDSSIKILKK